MLVDLPQSGHAHAAAELVQDAHTGHLRLATQTGELSPRALLRQHLDQQIHRMHRRKQAQQMDPIKLRGTIIPPPPTGRAVRPVLIDKIVGNKRVQKIEQGSRAGRRKFGIHPRKPTAGKLTRQRQCQTP
jgi:hypothetical protein